VLAAAVFVGPLLQCVPAGLKTFHWALLQVVRKSEWQASLAKGQRSYAAMRSGPAAPTGSTNRSWTGAASAAAGGASAGGTGVAAAPAAGVTES
jgi:hypothetical protein